MAKFSIINNTASAELFKLTGDDFFEDKLFILKDIRRIPVFVDHHPTDATEAYEYDVVNATTFDSIKVRIAGDVPVITAEELRNIPDVTYVNFAGMVLTVKEAKFGKAELLIYADKMTVVD